MNQEDYSIILQECTTGQDDYVNASELCKRFGKRWTDFVRLTVSKKYLKALEGRGFTVSRTIQAGKYKQVFVHPYVAIRLAEWIDPEFEIFVKSVFKKYLEGDADLGADMIERDQDPARVERAKRRLEVTAVNKGVHDLVHELGNPFAYARVHNDRYNGLYRKTAKELREECGAKKRETPLNYMSSMDLTMNRLVQDVVLESGDLNSVRATANNLRVWYEKSVGKKLEPKWEDSCLPPKKAREDLK